jgi:hypothetical protein
MKNKLMLRLLFLLLPVSLFAQLDPVQRAEIKLTDRENETNFNVHTLKDHGFLLVTEGEAEKDYKNTLWTFVRYDTLMQVLWKKEMLITRKFQAIKNYTGNKEFFVFFKEKEARHMKVMRMDLQTGDHQTFPGDLPAHLDEFGEFKVLGNTALIGGKISRSPVILSFRFFDSRVKVLPALYDHHFELTSINLNEEENLADVVISENNRRKNQMGLQIKSYNYSGKLLQDITLRTTKERILQTGKLSHLPDNRQFLLGNYTDRSGNYSLGMYVSKIEGNEQQFIKYYDFTAFKNFFNYLKPRHKKRVLERIRRRRMHGKDSHLRYRLLVHDLIKHDSTYIAVAEVYYPQYRSNTSWGGYGLSPWMYQNSLYNPSYLYNNSYRNYNDRIFEGYRYTHAIVCGFDAAGNLLWDNCFDIGGSMLSKTLEEVVHVGMDNDNRLILMYPDKDELHTQIIRGDEVVAEKEKYTVSTKHENDKVTNSETMHLSHWYGQYFLSWGVQEIYNKALPDKPSRKVFYLNKMTYKPKSMNNYQ